MKLPVAFHVAIIALFGMGLIGGGNAQFGSASGFQEPEFGQQPVDQTVIDGASVSFTCSVYSDSSVNISWMHSLEPNVELPPALLTTPNDTSFLSYMYMFFYVSTLTLDNVTASYEGVLTCNVTDLEGGNTISSASAFLTVLPVDVVDFSVNVSANYLDNVTISCVATSFRSDVDISWSTTATRALGNTTTVALDDNQYSSSLTVTNVGIDAAGVYTCTAENSVGSDSESIAVDVTVPPPVVVNSSSNTSVSYNDTVTISCTAVSAGSAATITWSTTANVSLPDTTTESLDNDRYASSLTLADVGLTATGIYTCTVENSGGSDSGSISVEVEAPPPTVIEQSPDVVAIYQDDVVIFCVVESLTSDLTVTWSSPNNASFPNETVPLGDDLYNSSLTLTAIGLDAVGVYTCTAQSSSGNDFADIAVNVTVFDANVTSSSENVIAVYGDDVTVFCTVVALGSNVGVTWSTTANISLPDSTTTVIGKNEYNGTLTLTNVTPESDGTYTCRVESDFANDTEDINLFVNVFPTTITSSSKNVTADYGDDVTLFCTVLALGSNVDIMWSTSANISLPDPLTTSTNKNEYNSTLSLDNVTLESDGNYTCSVESDFGNDTEDLYLSVIVYPAMVIDISDDVDAVYQDNVTLTCTAFGSDVTVSWSTTANVSLPEATIVSTGGNEYQSSLTLTNVSLQATGNYTCNAENPFGNDSETLNVTVRAPPPEVTVPFDTVDVYYQDNVTIFCLVTSILNEATINWTTSADISPLPAPMRVPISNDQYNSSLTLVNVGPEAIGDYICTATSSSGTDFKTITVNVIGPSLEVTIMGPNVTVVGNSVAFSCNVSDVDLVESYRWDLVVTDTSGTMGFGEKVLQVNSIHPNTSIFTCFVTDIFGIQYNDSFVLKVLEPTLVSQFPVGNVTREQGDSLTISCTVAYPDGADNPLMVYWMSTSAINAESTNTTNSTNLTVTSVLQLDDVQPNHAGFYTCVYAFDTITSYYGDPFRLIVEYAPFVDVDENSPSPHRLNRGVKGSIVCAFPAVPEATIMLTREGTTLISGTGEKVEYVIETVTDSDAGMYICMANNSFGNAQRGVNVIVQDVPDVILGSSVTASVQNFFEVLFNWPIPGANNNPINGYDVHYQKLDGFSTPSMVTAVTNNVTLKLDPGSNYSVIVSAVNGVGPNLNFSEQVNRTFSSITPDEARPSLSLPTVLVNSTSAYVTYELPPLALEANSDDMFPTVERATLTYEGDTSVSRDVTLESKAQYIGDLSPDTLYNVKLVLSYDVDGESLESSPVYGQITTLPIDNMPEEQPEIDEDGVTDLDNLVLDISWTPLQQGEGREYLQNYAVDIRVEDLSSTSVRKRQANLLSFTVPPDMSTYTYDNAMPFMRYFVQVLAELDVNGMTERRPITGVINVDTPESVPSSPAGLQVTILGFTNVTLSWRPPPIPNGVIRGYRIYYYPVNDPSAEKSIESTNPHLEQDTLYGLRGSVTYRFRVAAYTSVGEGDSDTVQGTTHAGVFPPGLTWDYIDDVFGEVSLQVNVSDLYGPISHYFVVVVLDNSITNFPQSTLLPEDTAPEGYYVALVVSNPTSVTNVVVGDRTESTYNSEVYENVRLKGGQDYNIFVRAYSAASDPEDPYNDSAMTALIFFQPTDLTLIIVIPIVLLLIIVIVVVIAVFIVCLWIRRSSSANNYYLGEITKTDSIVKVSPQAMNLRTSSSGNGTRSNNLEMRNLRMYTPTVSVPQSEVFTSVGQPTVLLCDANGTPPPEVVWSKDGKMVSAPHYIVLADNSLYIVNTDLSDEGSYIVSASNSAGTVEEMVRVTVVTPVPPDMDINHPPVTVSEFTEKMALLRSALDEGLEDEYHDVELEWNFTTYAAKMGVNHNKNRYVNIIPYDHSRVALPLTDEGAGSDYINASYVDGFNNPNGYIATQGPIPASFNDFWRMVWELDSPTIVMVTNLKEDEKIKCHQYWPSYGTTTYGMLQVTLKGVETVADYCIRNFTVSPASVARGVAPTSKEVRQFHFLVWPDHGVPQYATALLGFRKRVNGYHSSKKKGPMVVHCSAGVGRTGTFITIDSMLHQIDAKGTLDIFNFVRHMRFRRNYMVQTPTQYEFLHDALLEAIIQGDTSIPISSLQQTIGEMVVVDPTTGKSKFLSQFETLEAASPSDEDFDSAVAKMSDNMAKNRIEFHLPSNDNRVVLSTDHGNSDYICASIVDGYRQRDAFIAAQGPMKNTCGDFWRMVWEQKSAAVVMLTQLKEDGVEQSAQYWPSEKGEPEVYGSFQVELCTDDQMLSDYTTRKFKISLVDSPQESRTITQFHYLQWPSSKCPEKAASLIDLIGDLLRVQRKSGNGPITVHCSDGLGRTGTFCAVFTVLERVKTEQVVDVFQTVKSMRTRRAGLLQSLDQYEFVHKAVLEFLSSFDNYCNFK